jgi:uncharacterized damage-inducible protein DinB
MTSADLLADAFDRIREEVHDAVDGLTEEQLAFRVDDDANSIAWLVWHLTRVQDDHVSDVTGADQEWTDGGWAQRFALPFGRLSTGYEHGSADVGAVRAGAELLTGYHDAVFARTTRYVRTLTDADLPRVVDESWDPPVTLGVRLVSVISDDLQHVGQAAFVRGILLRR